MSNYTLELIKAELEGLGLDCEIEKNQDETTPPYVPSRLVVFGGIDSKNREQKMIITEQAIETGNELSTNPNERNRRYVRIQLDAPFPFAVKDTALADVSQFLHFLDLQIELPGFYLNYFDNTILYRCVHIADIEHVPIKVIVSILGIVMFLQDAFGGSLERLANGEVTFVELLQEIQKLYGEMAKKL